MSLMAKGRFAHEEAPTAERPTALDAALTKLLDHIAVELAEEYVALMEEAAADEVAGGSETVTREAGEA